MPDVMSFDELCDRLQVLKDIERDEFGEKMFMKLPERWGDAPHYRCPNGHVSTSILIRSEGPKDACLACCEPVRMTFPEDEEDGPLMTPDEFREMRRRTVG